MFRRGFVLLALGCSLGLLFATWLQPRSVRGDDAPPELMRDPAPPSAKTRDLSQPFVQATRAVRPTVVQILNFQRDPRTGQLFRAGSGSGFLFSKQEFGEQVARHQEQLETLFGQTPRVFRNTELTYSNELAAYIGGRGAVQLNDVEAITSSSRGALAWDLADAFGKRDLPQALSGHAGC